MPIPILPALIAGAAYLIYSGFREEGPVATPKRGPGRPKGAKAKVTPKVATKPPSAGTKPKAEQKSPGTGTMPKPKPKPKPEPKSRQSGTMPVPKPEPKTEPKSPGTETIPSNGDNVSETKEVTDDVPRETSPETGTMSDADADS